MTRFTDFFDASGRGMMLFSERAKQWLEREGGEWLVFEEFPVRII